MRLCYFSDMHLEFTGLAPLKALKVPQCNVLVVAGDFFPIEEPRFKEALQILKDKAPQVVYVAGNHEFYDNYGTRLARFSAKIDYFNSLSQDNLIMSADYKTFELLGKKWHIGTLWFPWLPDTHEMYLGPQRLYRWADFEYIKGVTEIDIDNLNNMFDKCLLKNLVAGDVVVSHHLPSYRCVDRKYIGLETNRFFVGGEHIDLITERKPAVWIHGHTHEPVNLKIDETLVVCNPHGYPNQVKVDWRPRVITV